MREVTTRSPEETISFGRTLADLLIPPKLVLLRGDLGAGKTTLVKGIAAAFDAASEEDVTSPTFTLIHEYGGGRVYHVDFYRLETSKEAATLGLEELFDREAVVLIEWGERFPQVVPPERIEVRLRVMSEDEREIEVARIVP